MLTFTDVALQFGGRVLFDQVNFTLFAKQKIGITGANGSGKSSFFKLLLNELSSDSGQISLPQQLIIGHVSQDMPMHDIPAIDYVIAGDLELMALQQQLTLAEQAGDHHQTAILHNQLADREAYSATARAAKLLDGLGFTEQQYSLAVNAFSGGWRMRLNLARTLMRRCDLLLLDEPTNHLDLDAILWLEKWLKNYSGMLLLISHDREFLDAAVDYMLHFEQQQIKLYTGNYSTFEQQRANQLLQQQAAYEKQQRAIAHAQSFIDRFKAKASKAKQAQSRVKALARMELVAAIQAESAFNFSFFEPAKSLPILVKLEQAHLGYENKTILTQVNLRIEAGARIGLLGPNGAGKSTLIKLLAGILSLQDGQYEQAKDIRIGYYAQHQLEQLNALESPLQHMQRLAPKITEQQLRDFLGGFGFSNDTALTAIKSFSGGEKARLALALIVWQRPNLLLLDEPTNHLDLEMRAALTLALQQYQGAVVVVSHDRYLLRTTVEQFLLVANHKVAEFSGDLEDYQQWLTAFRQSQKPEAPIAKTRLKEERKQQRELIKQLELRIKQLEKIMPKYTAELETIEQKLADPELYQTEQRSQLGDYLAKQAELKIQLNQAETEWLDLSEQLELTLG
ncbi:MAG: transporter ATP-binding protein [Gammaproteobacteria bacterium]|jgi:ATP-binding cassette subfamily F protein 3|nr:transporter ATP-binding protein [Gammaproteobacteria bacterium]